MKWNIVVLWKIPVNMQRCFFVKKRWIDVQVTFFKEALIGNFQHVRYIMGIEFGIFRFLVQLTTNTKKDNWKKKKKNITSVVTHEILYSPPVKDDGSVKVKVFPLSVPVELCLNEEKRKENYNKIILSKVTFSHFC